MFLRITHDMKLASLRSMQYALKIKECMRMNQNLEVKIGKTYLT